MSLDCFQLLVKLSVNKSKSCTIQKDFIFEVNFRSLNEMSVVISCKSLCVQPHLCLLPWTLLFGASKRRQISIPECVYIHMCCVKSRKCTKICINCPLFSELVKLTQANIFLVGPFVVVIVDLYFSKRILIGKHQQKYNTKRPNVVSKFSS